MSISNTIRAEAGKKCEAIIHHTNVEKKLLIGRKTQVDGVVEPRMKSLAARYKETINGLSKMGESHTYKLGGIMEKKYTLRQKYIELQQYLNTRIETCVYIIETTTSLQKNLPSTNSVIIEHTIFKMGTLYHSIINWGTDLQNKYDEWSAAFTIAMNAINAAYATIQGVHNVNHSNNDSTKKSSIRFRNGNNVRIIPSRNELKQMELEEELEAKMKAKMENNEFSSMVASVNALSGGRRRKRTLRKKRTLRNRA